MSNLAERIGSLSPEQRELFALRLRQKSPNLLKLQPIPRRTGGGPCRLTYEQERLWFIQELFPEGAAFNINRRAHFRFPLDVPVLRCSLEELVRRQEILRTRFALQDGVPLQIVQPAVAPALPVVDLSALPVPCQMAEQNRRAIERARQPFDLAAGDPLRLTLFRVAAADHVLLISIHHICVDWWSFNIFQDELTALYRDLSEGRTPALPELPIQFADFAVWQRSWLLQDIHARGLLAYWRERLAGAPAEVALPSDRTLPPVATFQGARRCFFLSPGVRDGLQVLGRSERSTLFILLLAAFAALLSRVSRQDDFAIGSPVADRGHPETEKLIGYFLNLLVLRVGVAEGCSFRELVSHTRSVVHEAFAHQEFPFGLLLEELKPLRSLNRMPLFQVAFIYVAAPAVDSDEEEEDRAFDPGTARVDLTLVAEERPGELRVFFEYSSEIFDSATMDRLAGYLEALLAAALTDPAARVSDLPMLSAAERAALVWDWNDTVVNEPWEGGVHTLFSCQARRAPASLALEAGNDRLTYAELDRRSSRLASRLRCLGVGLEAPVAVALERTAALPVALLGILKAGAAYVPLDPSYPRERLALILEDSKSVALIADGAVAARLFGDRAAPLPVVAADGEHDGADPPSPTVSDPGPANLAYIIFTSGSTGRPKGVEVTHGGLVRLLKAMQEKLELTSADRMLALTSVSFDISAAELFLPLLAGGCCVLTGSGEAVDGARLAASCVTVMQATPATWQMLLESGWGGAPRLTAITGGEAVSPSHAAAVRERTRVLWNFYGPTETTVWSTAARMDGTGRVSIGRPLPGTRVHVLDRAMGLVSVGTPGEICIGGIGLARGYRDRPDLTAERFVPAPWTTGAAGDRLYRTGDLGRQLADGSLEFLGRFDHQIKVRGFRIELGEIEAALERHPAVAQAVAVARGEWGDRQLLAYVTLVPGAGLLAAADLQAFLRERLPEPMVPAACVVLAAFPLTLNGKVDRRALPEPQREAAEADLTARPRTAAEELLVGIWKAVLGVEKISVHDDFFALGGHSLLATRLLSRVRTALDVELPLRALFQAPTPVRLAALAESVRGWDAGSQAPPLRPVPRRGGLPLSFAQQRLWFLAQLAPESPAYNIPAAVQMRGSLDPAALARTLAEISRRHEVLRTTFDLRDGEPLQIVAPAVDRGLPQLDLIGLPEAVRAAEARRLIYEEARRPFDLRRGPLMRPALVRMAPDEHLLLVTVHHIAFDGWSSGVFVRELAALYRAFTAGEPSPLAEPVLQYADFADWQRRWLKGEVLERQLAYWRNRLAGMPPALALPADRPRPPVQTFRGAVASVQLPAELSAALREICQQEGVTFFMLMLAAFVVLLQRYTGRDDVVVGTNVANRNRREVEDLIGLFVNNLVLRCDLSGDPCFRELLAQVRDVCLEGYAHQDLPFERLVEELQPVRDPSRSPLFQVLLVCQNTLPAVGELPGLDLSSQAVDGLISKFDLSLFVTDRTEGIECQLEYNTDLFEPVTAHRMLAHLGVLLEEIAADLEDPVSLYPLVAEPAKEHQIDPWLTTPLDASF